MTLQRNGKQWEERCDYLIYLAQDPMADPVRSDPRFVALMKKTGLG